MLDLRASCGVLDVLGGQALAQTLALRVEIEEHLKPLRRTPRVGLGNAAELRENLGVDGQRVVGRERSQPPLCRLDIGQGIAIVLAESEHRWCARQSLLESFALTAPVFALRRPRLARRMQETDPANTSRGCAEEGGVHSPNGSRSGCLRLIMAQTGSTGKGALEGAGTHRASTVRAAQQRNALH
jgi:hypothetical protein